MPTAAKAHLWSAVIVVFLDEGANAGSVFIGWKLAELLCAHRASLVALRKESACNTGDPGSIPGLGRSPGEGNGNPLQCASHTFLYDVYPSVK